MLSQTLTLPVFESTGPSPQNWTGSDPHSQVSWTDSVGDNPQCFSLMDFPARSSGSNGISTPATSVQTWPAPPGSSSIAAQQAGGVGSGEAAQLRRSNVRLKERYQQAESEIVELRDASRAARVELSRADDILEALMDSGDMSGKVYESLVEVSKLLQAVSGKLRSGG